jgi:hypothetical protein
MSLVAGFAREESVDTSSEMAGFDAPGSVDTSASEIAGFGFDSLGPLGAVNRPQPMRIGGLVGLP